MSSGERESPRWAGSGGNWEAVELGNWELGVCSWGWEAWNWGAVGGSWELASWGELLGGVGVGRWGEFGAGELGVRGELGAVGGSWGLGGALEV